MKTLISTLILGAGLVLGGCGNSDNQRTEDKKDTAKIKDNRILRDNYIYESQYRVFTFAGDTIKANTFEKGGRRDHSYEEGFAIKTTKKCTTYIYYFDEKSYLGDTLLNLFVSAKNFSQNYSFWKNSEDNSLIKKEAEAKGYTLLNMYKDILYKEKLTEDSIKREEQKRIDEIVLKNL